MRGSTRTESRTSRRLLLCSGCAYSPLPNVSVARKILPDGRVSTIRCKISVLHPLATSRRPDQWRPQPIWGCRRAFLPTRISATVRIFVSDSRSSRTLLSTERCVRNGIRGAGNSVLRPSTDASRFSWTFGAAFQVDELISSFDHPITTSMFFSA